MTILLGAMTLLAESKNFNGTVRAIFQPAEEPGKGAKAMIDDGLFEKYPVDEIYGLHNIPFLPEGEIHTRPGGIMASEDNFTIKIHGRGGHASSPMWASIPSFRRPRSSWASRPLSQEMPIPWNRPSCP